MYPQEPNRFSRWSQDELRKAEATAGQFLEQNRTQIAETLRARASFVEMLIQKLSSRETTSISGWSVLPGSPRSPI